MLPYNIITLIPQICDLSLLSIVRNLPIYAMFHTPCASGSGQIRGRDTLAPAWNAGYLQTTSISSIQQTSRAPFYASGAQPPPGF